jgi:hypothetical protein
MIIKVKAKHIRLGEKQSRGCPVYLAILDATGNERFNVDHYNKEVHLSRNTHENIAGIVYYVVPRSVKRFVEAFDDDRKVKPFNFKLVEI